MKRFLSSLIAILFLATTNGQQLDFTNYYLNYGKHIHDFSSSEQEGETGESESGQAGKSYEYMFDRMHTNHGFDPVQYFKVLKEESEIIHPYRSLNTNFDWEFLGPTNLTSGTQHNQGQLIDQIDLSKDNGIHYLNARNWQAGLYILDLIVYGKVVESKSVVVKH